MTNFENSYRNHFLAVFTVFCVAAGMPADAAVCPGASSGKTALQTAADSLSPGEWCEMQSTGLSFDLISDSLNPTSNALDYGGKGIYDAIRKKVRFLGGPHGNGRMRLVEYDETGDSWGNNSVPGAVSDGHSYDHNTVDPATGFHYIRKYFDTRFFYWNGSAWNEIARDNVCSISQEEAIGFDWDVQKGGLLHASEEGGLCFWDKATNRWSYLGDPGFTNPYHFTAAYNHKHNATWLQDYANTNHSVYVDGTIRKLSSTPPSGINTVGCCGSGGVITIYDYASGLFLVVNPRTTTWAEFDIVNDTWRVFENSLPITHDPSYGITSSFQVSISPYGVLMFFVSQGQERAPKVFIYRHAAGGAPAPTRPLPPTLTD